MTKQRSRNLSPEDVELIVGLLDGWGGALTWKGLIEVWSDGCTFAIPVRPCIPISGFGMRSGFAKSAWLGDLEKEARSTSLRRCVC